IRWWCRRGCDRTQGFTRTRRRTGTRPCAIPKGVPVVRAPGATLLRLRSRKAHLALGAKDVAVEACNPTTPARRDVEITDGGLDMWRDSVPIKLRISMHEVRRRFIPELLVQTTLFKFVVKGVGFSQIMRVTKLTDEIGGSQQRPFFVDAVVAPGRVGEARAFDCAGDARTVE